MSSLWWDKNWIWSNSGHVDGREISWRAPGDCGKDPLPLQLGNPWWWFGPWGIPSLLEFCASFRWTSNVLGERLYLAQHWVLHPWSVLYRRIRGDGYNQPFQLEPSTPTDSRAAFPKNQRLAVIGRSFECKAIRYDDFKFDSRGRSGRGTVALLFNWDLNRMYHWSIDLLQIEFMLSLLRSLSRSVRNAWVYARYVSDVVLYHINIVLWKRGH